MLSRLDFPQGRRDILALDRAQLRRDRSGVAATERERFGLRTGVPFNLSEVCPGSGATKRSADVTVAR